MQKRYHNLPIEKILTGYKFPKGLTIGKAIIYNKSKVLVVFHYVSQDQKKIVLK